MHKQIIGDREFLIGDYDLTISDMAVRSRVFVDEVVGKNKDRKTQTSEDYLGKLATRLIYCCFGANSEELIDCIIDGLFMHGYIKAAYQSKMFKYYYLKLIELGYKPYNPIR